MNSVDAAEAVQLSKKFYVLHQRHVRKSAALEEQAAAAEEAMIAAADSVSVAPR